MLQISVAMPTYNASSYLREAIDSVLSQKYPPEEIIVVDDGSTDQTANVCKSYGNKLRYIYRDNDGTYGIKARELAIEESRYDWIALMDHDDLWLPDKLQKQVAAAMRYPDAGVIFTQYDVINANGIIVTKVDQNIIDNGIMMLSPHKAFHHLLESNPYCPSSALISRRILQNVGMPDAHVCGDWSQWLSIVRESGMVLIPESLTLYRIHDGNFCASKYDLAVRMHETLKQQYKHLYPHCVECKESYAIGERHIRHIYEVAARSFLDQYHNEVLSGEFKSAKKKLLNAYRSAPREILKPLRLAAILKNLFKGAFSGRKEI